MAPVFSDEITAQIKENNQKITDLMRENEALIRSVVPTKSFATAPVLGEDKINIANGIIRTADSIIIQHHLTEIIPNRIVRKNIAYSYQLADWYTYTLNRFFIWGSVNTMLMKNAIINLVSIFEAVVCECANNICQDAKICHQNGSKETCFNQSQRRDTASTLNKLNEISVTHFTTEQLDRIKVFIGYRNHIHIRLAEENEFSADLFTISLHNEIISYLNKLLEYVFENGVPQYKKCVE